jgi:hypothetical protein
MLVPAFNVKNYSHYFQLLAMVYGAGRGSAGDSPGGSKYIQDMHHDTVISIDIQNNQ